MHVNNKKFESSVLPAHRCKDEFGKGYGVLLGGVLRIAKQFSSLPESVSFGYSALIGDQNSNST